MSRIFTFRRSVVLEAPPDAVFDFHQDPRNLRKISPQSLRVRRIEADPVARVGGRFEIDAAQFGVPIRWVGEWERVECPHLLVDVSVRSPFRIFRHRHEFGVVAGREGETVMTDQIEFAFGFGPIGSVMAIGAAAIVFPAMFRARHRATAEWFAAR